MTGADRDRARQRLAEAFVREASRIRFNPPVHCAPINDEQREAYLRRAIGGLAEVIQARSNAPADARP